MTDRIGSQGRLQGMLARFRRDQRGAVAVWYAILLVPIVGLVWGAIKFTELSERRTNMTDAMDASALAMARWIDFNNKDACQVATGNSDADAEDRAAVIRYAKEFFDKNYPQAEDLFADRALTVPWTPNDHLVFDLTCSKITVKSDAFADMGGVLGEFFNVGSAALDVQSEITLAGAGRVEIALVLDVSGSMSQNIYDSEGNPIEEEDEAGNPIPGSTVTKMEGLKIAVAGMFDELFGESDTAVNEFVRIGIVPFNSLVNVGAELANDNLDWFDTTAESYWHGSDFIHVEPGIGASRAQQIHITNRKVNHFDLFASVPGVDWKGCVESRPFPLDELANPPGTRLDRDDYDEAREMPDGFVTNPEASDATKNRITAAWADVPDMDDYPTSSDEFISSLNTRAASRFVPIFYPDEPDCYGMPYQSSCQTFNDDTAPSYGKTVPAWTLPYNDPNGDYSSLLDHPKDPGHAMWHYENVGFIRDHWYIDPLYATGETGRWYHDYLLDFRNSWRTEGLGNCSLDGKQRHFHQQPDGTGGYIDVSGDDTDEIVAHAKRFGILTNDHCHSREYRMRQAYPGVWDAATNTYKHKYDLYRADRRLRYQTGRNDRYWRASDPIGPNYRCGPAIQVLSSEKAVLEAHMETLQPYGGTNSAIGMGWGFRMLTPDAPLDGAADPTTPAGQKWRKFAILMSDGKNNINGRYSPNMSTRSAYGYGVQDRLNIVPSGGDVFDTIDAYGEEMDHKTIRICHRMQAAGIKVFTVGYGLNRESPARANAVRAMLKACSNSAEGTSVVDSSGNPTGVTFVDAANPEELQRAFEDITDAIEELHISG